MAGRGLASGGEPGERGGAQGVAKAGRRSRDGAVEQADESATTGWPKRCMLAHGAVLADAALKQGRTAAEETPVELRPFVRCCRPAI